MNIIVLEHPRIASEKRFNDIANTPLWSCLMGGYAAAALSANRFEPLFIDDARPGAGFDATLEKVLSHRPDLICVNAVYFWEHTPELFDFLSDIKARAACCHINLFGFFPTLVYRQILSTMDAVDSVAVGEFEHTLVELARALETGGSLDGISGLAMKSCLADTRERRRPPHRDPDVFDFPQRSSLEGTVSILGSRGCYNHCSFCPVPSFYNQGSLWRGRSPDNIVREMQVLNDQGVTSFYFCDPNFIGPGVTGKQRILSLMDRIKPMNIRFGMETRPQDLDDELLENLVEAGFESLLMGVESGSDTVLNRIDKSSGPHQAARAISLCRKHGIEPEIGFLMFIPDSGLRDLQQNMAFLMENRLLDRLDRTANLLSHTQIVLAGTSGFSRFEQKGLLKKSGIFGFEAEVAFSDPAVEWMARLVTSACHGVLMSMSDKESPVFWENQESRISQSVNDYLVTLCYKLMDRAESAPETIGPETIEPIEKEINADIRALLGARCFRARDDSPEPS